MAKLPPTKMRFEVALPDHEFRRLEAASEILGKVKTHIVREAIEEKLDREQERLKNDGAPSHVVLKLRRRPT